MSPISSVISIVIIIKAVVSKAIIYIVAVAVRQHVLGQRSRLPLLMLKADGLIYFVVERIFGEENKYWPDNWCQNTQQDDIQHNDNQHKRLISDTQHNDA